MKLLPKTILRITLATLVSTSCLLGTPPEPLRGMVGSRTIRLSSMDGIRGTIVEVPVIFSSQGNEAAILFTITYDLKVLSSQNIRLGNGGPDTSSLTVNASTPGIVTILVDWDDTLTAGDLHLVTVVFEVNTGTAVEETLITLENCSVSDRDSKPLTVSFNSTLMSISSAKISGRVLTPDGRGSRNATVLLTAPDGAERRTTTGSLGYFEFGEVAVGTEYYLQVRSKRLRFAPRSVVYDGSSVDLVGIE